MRDNNELMFLEIIGNIDEKYIECVFEPIEKQRIIMFKKITRVVACILVIAIISSSLLFPREVIVAWNKIVSQIATLLQLEEDISDYIDIINKKTEKNGISISLDEVVVDDNQLLIQFSFNTSNEYSDILMDSIVKIDGKEITELKEIYSNEDINGYSGKQLFGYYINDSIKSKNKILINIDLFIKEFETNESIEKFEFEFTASPQKLRKDSVEIVLDKVIPIEDNKNIILKKLNYNVLGSQIIGSCANLILGTEYYIKGYDDQGNSVSFRLFNYNDSNMVFVSEKKNKISATSSLLKLKIYKHPLGSLFKTEYEDDIVWEHYIDEEVEEMVPISEEFIINLK